MQTQLPRLILTLLIVTTALVGCSREDSTQQAQDYLNRAEAYRDQGQYRAAMIEITNAMNSAPNEVRYPIALAEVYNALGAGRRASELLEEYIDEHPGAVALPLAEAYLMQGKFLSAQETLQNFTPSSADESRELALYQADIQRIQGNLEASEQAYQALLEEYPEDMEIKLRLVENHIFRGQSEAAQEILTRLRQQHPEEPEPLHLSAIVALQTNDLARAERLLTDALIYMPDADIMLPDRAAVLQLLAETLTAQGRTAEALVYQKALAEESPESVAAQQRLQEAVVAAEAGDYDKAETILKELLEENPDSQSAALMLGMVSLSQGDFDSAEPLLSRSVDVETANTDVIRATVMAQAETGNAEQALQTLQRSLKARPDNAVLLSLYGVLALNTPELQQEGYLSIQKALAQDPHRGGLRLALARYHFQRGEVEQGMAQLRTAFNYQPADWAVTNVYMNQLLARGQLDEVAEAVAKLKEAAPKAPETALFEAQYRFRDGNQQNAIRQMETLLATEPDYARGHGVLAQMYHENGQSAKALASVERVVELEPQNDQALRAGVEIISSGNLSRSPQDWLASVASATPAARPNATALRAMLYRDAGNLEQASELMSGYRGEETDYTRQVTSLVYRDRARQLAGAGEFDRARELLGGALEDFPTSLTLNLDLVRLDLAQGRLEQARVLLDDLQERHPGNAEVAVMSARVTQAEEGAAAAYRELRAAWNEQPDSEMAGLLLALAREQAPQAVPEILQQWERAAPENRGRLLFMAEEYQRQGDEAAAITAYERLLANNPNDAIALNNLAWMLKERDLDRALTLAEKAAELQPNSAPILDTYGWLLHLNGDRSAALRQLERAVELAPNVPDIQDNLNTVRNAK
ncbi:tetratricopeptide repeat protein [Marinimicrobium agarilyticum]|uniref:tetratricopeptide repeat protein n=1 Tax=Marinimicrobium agarilyticum TaxID=306546 RepID=UPI000421DB4F|nr:tetratricopeptide repeat protein [Marinimicrobium agarilyticum]